jgi:hypothetical protein
MSDDGGQLPPTAHFEMSDDGGATWSESPLAGVSVGATPLVYAVAVDRANPDIVFMSSVGANPPSGDRLYRSSDGGVTWTEVLAVTGPILDVALVAGGSVLVATLGAGSFQSSDGGAVFTPVPSPPQLACVGQRDNGPIFGCAANWDPDFKAVVRSSDGATWDKVFRFVELAGPVDCPAGTPQHDTCAARWPSVKDQFGATGPAAACLAPPPAKTGGCCDAGRRAPGAPGVLAALCGLALLRRRR